MFEASGVTLTSAATDVSVKAVLHLLSAGVWVVLEAATYVHTYIHTNTATHMTDV